MVPIAHNDNASGPDQLGGGGADDSKPCPICRKASTLRWRPFCSKRCADIDLNRWLSGGYVIPARDDDPLDDEGDEGPATGR
ncbi:DNA gyrase inhibitor YacG (modular protein) [Hyphomicrobiales bacterium]|nr:DNA gyrase inhibitor YacG (modular protein) [Hyphomicrobiales bacterium]CAH1668004.1 DNA gyrase inhibitor YacG (modular protein) [Hyphomicrobiales bacterium]